MSLSHFVAGVDIGGTNLRCAIASSKDPSHLLSHRKAPTPVQDGPEAIVSFIASEILRCIEEAGISRDQLTAVGCATPGIVDTAAGTVATASNLRWDNVALADLLFEHVGVPAVVENDVRAAALAEYKYGAGRGRSSLVYFTISTGVSVGIVADGRLIRGRHHAAGEIAYFIPDPSHIGQEWTKNGCLEQTSGGVGIARLWAEKYGGPASPSVAEEVFRLAREGDEYAVILVERAADYLAQAAVAIGTLIDPEILVLGGSIAENEPRIVNRIREVTASSLLFPFEVTLAALGGDAPLTGALSLASERPSRISKNLLVTTP